jgi:hypothetical protein
MASPGPAATSPLYPDVTARKDWGRVGEEVESEESIFQAVAARQRAKLVKFQPITVQERFAGFARFGFRPYGIYLPADPVRAREVRAHLTDHIGVIGANLDPERDPEAYRRAIDARLQAYYAYQDETSEWERAGVPGAWTGQQAVARSRARFRVVGCARRWGKTELAAHEALSVAWQRPRSVVWLCAPIAKLVSRAFDIVRARIEDYRIPIKRLRDTQHERQIILENGARIEGVSMENIWSAAGDTVDYAVIDEAAQIEPLAWSRGIQPVLLDRNGQALLISSFEGNEGIFYQLFEEGEGRDDGVWEAFSGRTSENFYIAPQGDRSPALIEAKRTTEPLDYLEQYGGIPAHAKYLVYPEWKERVHTARIPFDPGHPVILAGDPSAGANEYAMVAIQDYPELRRVHVVDEVYQRGGITESVILDVQSRPWNENVTDVVLDSAMPSEIERWQRAGYNAYPVFEKPPVEETYPIVKHMLRDPVQYNVYHDEILAWLLHGRGIDPDDFDDLPLTAQREILIDLEEHLNDPHLPESDVAKLRACSVLRVDENCRNFISEHKNYQFVRPKSGAANVREVGRKWKDHTVDAFRYFAWQFYRWEYQSAVTRARSLVEQGDPLTVIPIRPGLTADDAHRPEPLFPERRGYLYACRQQFTTRPDGALSLIERG